MDHVGVWPFGQCHAGGHSLGLGGGSPGFAGGGGLQQGHLGGLLATLQGAPADVNVSLCGSHKSSGGGGSPGLAAGSAGMQHGHSFLNELHWLDPTSSLRQHLPPGAKAAECVAKKRSSN